MTLKDFRQMNYLATCYLLPYHEKKKLFTAMSQYNLWDIYALEFRVTQQEFRRLVEPQYAQLLIARNPGLYLLKL